MCKKNPKHKQRQLYTTTTAAAMQQQQQQQQLWPSLLGGGISRGSGPQLTQEDAADLVCPNSAAFAPVRPNGCVFLLLLCCVENCFFRLCLNRSSRR
jgi:hypothetical protein